MIKFKSYSDKLDRHVFQPAEFCQNTIKMVRLLVQRTLQDRDRTLGLISAKKRSL